MDLNHSLHRTPLKDMDAALLTLAIIDEIDFFYDMGELDRHEVSMIRSALRMSAYLHRSDTRKNTTKKSTGVVHQPSSPYIEHPLRNTMRLIRWGVKDAAVLSASLLHDTIEDHAEDICDGFLHHDSSTLTEKESRSIALDYVYEAFSPEVSDIVLGVSNPIAYGDLPRVEKNAAYAEHVREAVSGDAKVFLVKSSDLVDNALSLLHHLDTDVASARRAQKYLPLIAIFLGVLETDIGEDVRSLVSDNGYNDIVARLGSATEFLTNIA